MPDFKKSASARLTYNVSEIYDVFAKQKCGEGEGEGAAYISCYMQYVNPFF